MKSKKIFALLLLGGLLAAGCEKTPDPDPDPAARGGYVGTLSVIELGDERFERDGIEAGYTLDADSGRLDLYLYDVSFSSRMPVTLSVLVLPDVAYTQSGATLILADTDIVPLMESHGELIPYERYLCTDLNGTVGPDEMVLSMKLGGFRTDYRGSAAE